MCETLHQSERRFSLPNTSDGFEESPHDLDVLPRHAYSDSPAAARASAITEELHPYWSPLEEGQDLVEDVLRRDAACDASSPEVVAGEQLVPGVNHLLGVGPKLAHSRSMRQKALTPS
jgi:hypothetical protein